MRFDDLEIGGLFIHLGAVCRKIEEEDFPSHSINAETYDEDIQFNCEDEEVEVIDEDYYVNCSGIV